MSIRFCLRASSNFRYKMNTKLEKNVFLLSDLVGVNKMTLFFFNKVDRKCHKRNAMIYSCITMSMMQVLSQIVTNCLVITVLRLQTNPLRLCLFVCPLLCFLVVYIQTYKL